MPDNTGTAESLKIFGWVVKMGFMFTKTFPGKQDVKAEKNMNAFYITCYSIV